MRVLLDTNVLIDYFGRRQPYFDDCLLLFYAADFGDIELWASPKALIDAFYVLRKQVGADLLQEAFVRSLERIAVTPLDGGEVGRAAARQWPDFEGCFADECALSVGADFIVTRDGAGFSRSSLPVGSPRDLFALLEEKRGIVYEFQSLADVRG